MIKTSPYGWISQYFFSFFFVYGAYLPFWAVWLQSEGISSTDSGIILGLAFATRCVSNLVLTPRIQRVEQYIPVLRWCSVLCAVLIALHGVTEGDFVWIAVATVALNLFFGPIIPVSDALANHYTTLNMLDYGRTRLWGSVAFIVGSSIVGWVVTHWGENWILYCALIGMLVTILLSLRLPGPPPVTQHQPKPGSRVRLAGILKEWPVIKFLFLIACIQGSHAAYYSFSSVYWKSVGYSESVVGYLWSLGVIAEICVFAFSQRFFKSWSVHAMFLLSAVAVIIRWGLMAMTYQIAVLVVIQLFHSLTFAVAHLAAIRYIQQSGSADRMIALQALYNAIPLGAVIAVMTTMSGWGYERWGSYVFLGMAVMGVIALFVRVEYPERTTTEITPEAQKSSG
ncbi:putative 3-phenylpropionic acid transporter [Vibrio aerogenes CECT 7868]|uniref:Putative 3-phenylpropionic acid transporter n=1 Tax=Vibrio aerogenes CECT 7868 TaxID=1216006 RepID=A0A1M5YS51_9VIBR|nr:3-phenylpropionate MFS transporter [Vibrio aerogenes]SHI14862.1 putative 3-phenylpropionic acid transporter [Vibrio aerogenes CECT 7868]